MIPHPQSTGFDPAHALACARLAALAYPDRGESEANYRERVDHCFARIAHPAVRVRHFASAATDTQGFITATDDCVVIAFRGSREPKDFVTDLRFHRKRGAGILPALLTSSPARANTERVICRQDAGSTLAGSTSGTPASQLSTLNPQLPPESHPSTNRECAFLGEPATAASLAVAGPTSASAGCAAPANHGPGNLLGGTGVPPVDSGVSPESFPTTRGDDRTAQRAVPTLPGSANLYSKRHELPLNRPAGTFSPSGGEGNQGCARRADSLAPSGGEGWGEGAIRSGLKAIPFEPPPSQAGSSRGDDRTAQRAVPTLPGAPALPDPRLLTSAPTNRQWPITNGQFPDIANQRGAGILPALQTSSTASTITERVICRQDAGSTLEGSTLAASTVHSGFLDAWDSVRAQVLEALATLNHRPATPLFVTGHSLGGALAVLCARTLSTLGHRPSTYTFGQPRVGDAAFASNYDAALRERTFRVVHEEDVVPRLPLWVMGFRHCGHEVFLPSFGVPASESAAVIPPEGGTPNTAGAETGAPHEPPARRSRREEALTPPPAQDWSLVTSAPTVQGFAARSLVSESSHPPATPVAADADRRYLLDPSLWTKCVSDALGLWQAWTRREEHLLRDHFMARYVARLEEICHGDTEARSAKAATTDWNHKERKDRRDERDKSLLLCVLCVLCGEFLVATTRICVVAVQSRNQTGNLELRKSGKGMRAAGGNQRGAGILPALLTSSPARANAERVICRQDAGSTLDGSTLDAGAYKSQIPNRKS